MSKLASIDVLVVDCQTTTATPVHAGGRLLEVCWSRFRADGSNDPRAVAIAGGPLAVPADFRLPARIAQLTGLSAATLRQAPPAREILGALERAADVGGSPPLVVAHAASFEARWLHDALPSSRSWRFICTLEIARRLLPGLPRRGLRALSGYLGHVLPSDKRQAPAHVRATCAVWSALLSLLADEAGVDDLAGLARWMVETKPARRGGRTFALPRELRLALPSTPGIYRFVAGEGEVLYVGKARDLKRRVNSYFQKQRHMAERTLEMLTQVKRVETEAAESALEAALLEVDAIKAHDPPYNVALRVDARAKRSIRFASCADLADQQELADATHTVGPLPGPRAAARLATLGAYVRGERRPELAERGAIDLPPNRVDEVTLASGVEVFYRTHAGRLGAARLVDWLRLGARLWRRELYAAAATGRDIEAKDDEAEAETEQGADEPWIAEQVVAALEFGVLQSARLLRRARLLVALVDAQLHWSPRAGEGRSLHLERGRVCGAADVELGADGALPRPTPASGQRSVQTRLEDFDLAIYDRLRVLLTEIRRLVAEGRPLWLQSGDVTLDSRALARRLRWC